MYSRVFFRKSQERVSCVTARVRDFLQSAPSRVCMYLISRSVLRVFFHDGASSWSTAVEAECHHVHAGVRLGYFQARGAFVALPFTVFAT